LTKAVFEIYRCQHRLSIYWGFGENIIVIMSLKNNLYEYVNKQYIYCICSWQLPFLKLITLL